jgi:dUTPase
MGGRLGAASPCGIRFGVIDADYADNPDNDGEIVLALWNIGDQPQRTRHAFKI